MAKQGALLGTENTRLSSVTVVNCMSDLNGKTVFWSNLLLAFKVHKMEQAACLVQGSSLWVLKTLQTTFVLIWRVSHLQMAG